MKQVLHKSTANRSLWRHRDLRLVMPARALSYVGDALALFALMLRIHDQGSGTAGMALLLAAFSLPRCCSWGRRVTSPIGSTPVACSW